MLSEVDFGRRTMSTFKNSKAMQRTKCEFISGMHEYCWGNKKEHRISPISSSSSVVHNQSSTDFFLLVVSYLHDQESRPTNYFHSVQAVLLGYVQCSFGRRCYPCPMCSCPSSTLRQIRWRPGYFGCCYWCRLTRTRPATWAPVPATVRTLRSILCTLYC